MSLGEQLQRFGRQIASKQVSLLVGVATEVDEEKRCFILEREGFAPTAVEMNAYGDGGEEYVLIVPAEGSAVVVGLAEEAQRAYLIQVSKVAKMVCVIDKTTFAVDAGGVCVERERENLGKCISDMIDELNKIVVVQGTTIHVGAMTNIKDRFGRILS